MTEAEIRLLRLEVEKYRKQYQSQVVVTKKIADYWAEKYRLLEENRK